jgi:Mrp family chromosome partitioning ATPase/capsular polysaccharide biosynthesis protein
MDIIAYLRVLRRHVWLIVLCAVIGGGLGAASTLLESETTRSARYYRAEHTLLVNASGGDDSDLLRPVFQSLDQLALLTTAGEVPDRVADELGEDPREIVTHLVLVTNGATQTLDIVAAYRDPQQAEAVANTFADELIATLNELEQTRYNETRDEAITDLQELKNQIATLDAQVANPPPGSNVEVIRAERDSTVNQYRVAYERFQQFANADVPTAGLTTLQSAEAIPIGASEYNARLERGQLGNNIIAQGSPVDENADASGASESTSFSGPVSRGVLGGLLGLIVGIGLAVVIDRVDRRLRTREEVESTFGMPVLAEIPALTQEQQQEYHVLSREQPMSAAAEAYRAVRSSLLFQRTASRRNDEDRPSPFVVMVSSPGAKEGKTTTVANLGVLFAETGARTLAMNCDYRRPTLHQYFGVENEPRQLLDSGVEGLWIIADAALPGDKSPFSVVDEQRRLIAMARERFDVVILDTAPMLATNDATELLDLSDLVVLVARVDETTSEAALRSRELLSRLDGRPAGVVMVGSEPTGTGYYHYLYHRGKKSPKPTPGPVPTPSSNGKTDKLSRRQRKKLASK